LNQWPNRIRNQKRRYMKHFEGEQNKFIFNRMIKCPYNNIANKLKTGINISVQYFQHLSLQKTDIKYFDW